MFTGIVTEVGRVVTLFPQQLAVRAGQTLRGLELGASVAVNGVCLTVTSFNAESFVVGLSTETLERTNLGSRRSGDPVNLERPLGLGGELGGHLVQGHVDGTGRLLETTPAGGSTVFRFAAAPDIMRYVVEKGFIAVDGISLTVMDRRESDFRISVIDYTKEHTNLGYARPGDQLNLEIDIFAKYAEQFVKARTGGLTEAYLRENGF